MIHLIAGTALLLALSAGTGCYRGDLEELRAQNEQILQRLAELEEGQKKLESAGGGGPQPEDPDKVYAIPLGDSPVRGNPAAPVAIVEYSDFQCSFCAQVQPLLMQLLEKYPDDIKLVYKHFPLSFHQAALPATVASLAAHEQGKFWEMHDVLFANIRSLSETKMEGYAREAGLDLDRFRRDLSQNKARYEAVAQEDFDQGRSVAVKGTPTLYVSGKKVQNRSLEAISAMIEEARREAGPGGEHVGQH